MTTIEWLTAWAIRLTIWGTVFYMIYMMGVR